MSDPTDNIPPKQHKAIAALMSTPTISAAAAAVGVDERTVYTWLREPAFDAAYRAACREALGQATARLHGLSSDAVDTLKRLLTCGKPAVELGAANAILDRALKATEIEDLRDELEQLRALVRERLSDEPAEL